MSLDQPNDFVKHQTTTRDAFLGGRLTLSQPARGFRAGLDSVLLGAAVRQNRGPLLDLGSGVGTAALVALALNRVDKALLIERDVGTLALARQNLDENGFGEHAEVLDIDILDRPAVRRSAGLRDNHFATVIANPPFFSSGQGTLAPDSSRADARHMAQDGLETWLRCAAGCAAGGGDVVVIYPAAGLAAVLAAITPRFGAVTVLPITPRPGQPATRVLVRGVKGSRAPLTLLASRHLHLETERQFTPEFDGIFRGLAELDW